MKGQENCKSPGVMQFDRFGAWGESRNQLTAETTTWACTKWNEFPPHLPALPPFRPELFHILAPDVGTMLHGISGNEDLSAFGDEDGQRAIRAPSARQSCIAHSDSLIERDHCSDAKALVDHVKHVLTRFELSKADLAGNRRTECFEDDGAKFAEDTLVAGKEVEDPAEQSASSVATRKE